MTFFIRFYIATIFLKMVSCLHTCHRWFKENKEKSETQNEQALDDAIMITMIQTKMGQIKTCSEDRVNGNS